MEEKRLSKEEYSKKWISHTDDLSWLSVNADPETTKELHATISKLKSIIERIAEQREKKHKAQGLI